MNLIGVTSMQCHGTIEWTYYNLEPVGPRWTLNVMIANPEHI
jgi:hypothetical protein